MIYQWGIISILVPSQQKGPAFLDSLESLSRGTITVSVSGYPVVSIDAGRKEVEVEVKGVREVGLSLRTFTRSGQGRGSALRTSESMAKGLSSLGWKLTLYEGGDELVRMGRGVSRLTGHISVNPIRLRRLIDALS